ncbi:MAG: hypothetical protein WCC78_00080, partial [Terriglobales bacterium]
HLTYLKNSGLVLDRRHEYRVYYRLTTSSSLDHKLLFRYLRGAFERDKLFAEDSEEVKGCDQGRCLHCKRIEA